MGGTVSTCMHAVVTNDVNMRGGEVGLQCMCAVVAVDVNMKEVGRWGSLCVHACIL